MDIDIGDEEGVQCAFADHDSLDKFSGFIPRSGQKQKANTHGKNPDIGWDAQRVVPSTSQYSNYAHRSESESM